MNRKEEFITHFKMKDDASKPGRVLSSVKVGDIYMSRLVIDPGVTTGNHYHKENRIMIYAEKGDVSLKMEHVVSKKRKDMKLVPGRDVIHIPNLVAHSTTNVGEESAIVVVFSNFPLRTDDSYEYIVK